MIQEPTFYVQLEEPHQASLKQGKVHGMARGLLDLFAHFSCSHTANFTDDAEGHCLLRRLQHSRCWAGGWSLANSSWNLLSRLRENGRIPEHNFKNGTLMA